MCFDIFERLIFDWYEDHKKRHAAPDVECGGRNGPLVVEHSVKMAAADGKLTFGDLPIIIEGQTNRCLHQNIFHLQAAERRMHCIILRQAEWPQELGKLLLSRKGCDGTVCATLQPRWRRADNGRLYRTSIFPSLFEIHQSVFASCLQKIDLWSTAHKYLEGKKK